MTDREKLIELAERLTETERALLLGEFVGWGSWIFTAGEYLVSLGLGTKRNGSITFDTPLAKELIAFLRHTPQQSRSPEMSDGVKLER